MIVATVRAARRAREEQGLDATDIGQDEPSGAPLGSRRSDPSLSSELSFGEGEID